VEGRRKRKAGGPGPFARRSRPRRKERDFVHVLESERPSFPAATGAYFTRQRAEK